MSRIFISYSSKDRDLVTALVSDLQALGHELWFDAELTRTGGQKWWSNILVNLRGCDLFVFALTPNSLASDPCKREYGYASALCKRILPVMLQNVDLSVLPTALQEIQFVDYRERSAKQGIALAATLSNLPPAQPMPEILPPEPETPLPPLAQLSQRMDAPSLSSAEQIEIVFELETLFNDVATHAGAETLLRKLYEREDLTNRVAEKIRRLIPDIAAVQMRPNAPAAEPPRPVAVPPAKETEPVVVVPRTDSIKRQHGRWLQLYFLVSILISVFLLIAAPSWNVYWRIDWIIPTTIFLFILNLVSIYGTYKWKKWGIYLLIGDLTFSAIVCNTPNVAGGGYLFGGIPFAVFTIALLVIALILLRRILRNKWQFFEGKRVEILGRQF